MTRLDRTAFFLIRFFKTATTLLTIIVFFSCHAQSKQDTIKSVDTNPKVAPESVHFTIGTTEKHPDGSKTEIDTTTGYGKYYYSNGKMQAEGKVTKAGGKDLRDGLWSYYNEDGQLMKQETYTKEGKINELDVIYFANGKPLSKTYQYYNGDYKDKATFKFHKIETMFYTNGQELAERHWINNELVDEKCWDNKGNPKPIEYLNTIKSVQANK